MRRFQRRVPPAAGAERAKGLWRVRDGEHVVQGCVSVRVTLRDRRGGCVQAARAGGAQSGRGEFLFIYTWAIGLTSCFVFRSTTSRYTPPGARCGAWTKLGRCVARLTGTTASSTASPWRCSTEPSPRSTTRMRWRRTLGSTSYAAE